MRVVDTSLWVELIVKGPLVAAARKAVEPLHSCIVPAMVHYELAKWCNRMLRHEEAKSVKSLLTECITADIDLAIATEAALLSAQHRLHATDAIIYATARLWDAPLTTCDGHFKDLPGVDYFEK
jgi:predicted nucleic acid-binding protein